MKKLTMIIALLVVTGLAGAPALYAATKDAPQISISAAVSGDLSLEVHLFKGLGDTAGGGPTGSEITAMNFGILQEKTYAGTGADAGKTFKELRSDDAGGMGEVVAMITANSHQAPYRITQNGVALTSGTNTIPTGACVVNTAYAAADNLGLAKPAAAVMGTGGTWVGTRTLYTSESAPSAMRTIQAHYAVTGDPAANATAAVLLNQANGNYAGTVIITVTT